MIARNVVVGLGLVCCTAPAPAKEPFVQPLRLEVLFQAEGPERAREELERALLDALDRSGCFARVERHRPESLEGTEEALLLRLVIDKVIDETEFDLSIAQRYANNAPPDALRQLTARLEVGFRMELWVLPGSVPLRAKYQVVRSSYRPHLDEDPREENRIQATDEAVRAARLFACKGSPKKLRKEIDRAREASGSGGAKTR